MKRKIGFLLISISMIFLIYNTTGKITGNLISTNFYVLNMNYLFALIFLVLGIFLFTQKKGLEYLILPTGWEEPRIKKAKEELDKNNYDKVIITGHVDKEKLKGSHRQFYYKELREYGVKPKQMRVLDGIDSEEDILYLGRFIKPGDTLYFDTFPLHFQEYKTLIKKAQKQNLFPKGVDIKNLKIKQGLKEWIYGTLGLGEELVKKRKLDYKKNRNEEKIDRVKEKVKKLIR